MNSASLTLRVTEENDRVWAEVAELPGCFASGADLDELLEAVNEAISLYVEDNPEAQDVIRRIMQAHQDVPQVIDFTSRRTQRSGQPRVVVKDIHADVEFDELIEA